MGDQLEFVTSYQFYSSDTNQVGVFTPTCIFFDGIYNG